MIDSILKGEVDINNREKFFKLVIYGLIQDLNEQLTIRNLPIPHFILNTGDDEMYRMIMGHDESLEPTELTGNDYIYNQVPRCVVSLSGFNLITDQLSSPYTRGQLELESDDDIYLISAEMRRMPFQFEVTLKYFTDNITDMMELIQHCFSKFVFIRNYTFQYLGQTIMATYSIPTSFEGQYQVEFDGESSDDKQRTMELSITIDSNFPVYNNKTAIDMNKRIMDTSYTLLHRNQELS